jgi:hypothetical protein
MCPSMSALINVGESERHLRKGMKDLRFNKVMDKHFRITDHSILSMEICTIE